MYKKWRFARNQEIYNGQGGSMNTGVVATFAVSTVCFVLTYLTLDEGYVWLLFLGVGIVLAGCGVSLAAQRRD